MMKSCKRALSLVLSLILVLALLPVVSVQAAGTETATVNTTAGGLNAALSQWCTTNGKTLTDIQTLIVTGTVNAADLGYISASINGLEVLDLGGAVADGTFSAPTFMNRNALTTVIWIPGAAIPDSMFYNCTALRTVSAAGATAFGAFAFYGCASLTDVTMPSAAYELPASVFYGCSSLETINISNATAIGNNAFNRCTSLTAIDLSNVTSFGAGAFYRCEELADVTWPDSPYALSANLFDGCKALASVDASNATSFGKDVFFGCSALSDVTLPASFVVSEGMFRQCTALTTLDLSGATGLNRFALAECAAIADVKMPASYAIPEGFFYGDKQLSILDLSGATSVGKNAFSYCTGLSVLLVDAALTPIDATAFVNVPALPVLVKGGTTVAGFSAFPAGSKAFELPAALTFDRAYKYMAPGTSAALPLTNALFADTDFGARLLTLSRWSSGTPAVATVSDGGVVSALTPGTSDITAGWTLGPVSDGVITVGVFSMQALLDAMAEADALAPYERYFTAATWADLAEAMGAAQDFLDNIADPTYAAYVTVLNDLLNALAGLRVDMSELVALVASADDYLEEAATPGSWAVFEPTLISAQDFLANNSNPTLQAYLAELQSLKDGFAALRIDTTVLEGLLARAEGENPNLYDPGYWNGTMLPLMAESRNVIQYTGGFPYTLPNYEYYLDLISRFRFAIEDLPNHYRVNIVIYAPSMISLTKGKTVKATVTWTPSTLELDIQAANTNEAICTVVPTPAPGALTLTITGKKVGSTIVILTDPVSGATSSMIVRVN